MAEYIEKERAIELIQKNATREKFEGNRAKAKGMLLTKYLIESIPAADVRENVRGEWVELQGRCNKGIVRCSRCGNMLDMRGVNAGRGDANFCLNCGADMRGGDDG